MNLFHRRSFRGDIVFAFALAAVAYAAWLVRGVLLLLYVSALFAVVLAPIVRSTSEFRVGRWRPFKGSAAIFLLLLAVAGALTAFGYLAFPPVIHDLTGLSGKIPKGGSAVVAKVRGIPFLDRLDAAQMSARLQDYASHAAAYLLLSVKGLAGELIEIVMGFILTVYFILEGESAYRWFLSFFPLDRRARLDETLQRADVRMGKWLLGQGSLMLILWAASTIVYVSLHVRYAYALGVLAGLLNLVPVLGSAVSIVLALIVAAIDSWGRVLGVAIFYAVYIQIENSFLTPRIMQNRVHLPGVAVIVALLLGFSLAGVVGAMVSVPTAVLVAVLLDEYLVQKDKV
ncbi:MAG: AI-2E family transporter [Terracidiphilus sp.]